VATEGQFRSTRPLRPTTGPGPGRGDERDLQGQDSSDRGTSAISPLVFFRGHGRSVPDFPPGLVRERWIGRVNGSGGSTGLGPGGGSAEARGQSLRRIRRDQPGEPAASEPGSMEEAGQRPHTAGVRWRSLAPRTAGERT